jgi:hypothetical protein
MPSRWPDHRHRSAVLLHQIDIRPGKGEANQFIGAACVGKGQAAGRRRWPINPFSPASDQRPHPGSNARSHRRPPHQRRFALITARARPGQTGQQRVNTSKLIGPHRAPEY